MAIVNPSTDAVQASAGIRSVAPEADDDWHQIAAHWYEALRESGQAQFYEASD